jgi:hypothetical protein
MTGKSMNFRLAWHLRSSVDAAMVAAYLPGDVMTFKNIVGLFGLPAALFILVPEAHADPTRLWSTYYGDSGENGPYGVDLDGDDGVVAVGVGDTTSGVAGNAVGYTTFDATYGGDGDGFVTRFDASGSRLWGTYFGGSDVDILRSVAVDEGDNTIAFGTTASASGLATVGDTTLSGAVDSVLVKFAPGGTRTWATYLGGDGEDEGTGVCVTLEGAIYVVGRTTSTSGLAFNAGHQSALAGPADAFVARFEADGTLRWATYYGGPQGETEARGCTTDAKEYVWVVGKTEASSGIALNGYDESYAGEGDGFVALFASEGELVHATYYGGTGVDAINGIACNPYEATHVYIAGYTDSANTGDVIADDGTTRSGFSDGFVAKLDHGLGVRAWGTLFGGEFDESVLAIDHDGEGLVLSGYTASTTGIATVDAQQTSAGGDYDAFFAAMDPSDGDPYYATYIGGVGLDMAFGVAGSLAFAAVGTGARSSGLASPGAWDTTFSPDLNALLSYFRLYTP